MPNVWPASLPQAPEIGWSEEKLPNVVTSETDAGPRKRRRRFTRAVRRATMTFNMRESQVATLEAFHTDTLADGSLRFDMAHPRTGAVESFLWVNALRYTETNRGRYRAVLELEYL